MVLKVNPKELQELIRTYYNHKTSLMVYGTFGIGKSRIIKDVSVELAKEKNKRFIEWNKLVEAEKLKLFENPEKYFVFFDVRLSSYDVSDIKGLPVFIDDKKAIDFKVPLWALYLQQNKSDGVVFFDEANLCPPLVLSSIYKIILDRYIDESRIADDWLIVLAGNLTSDNAYTTDMPNPIKDRLGEIELSIPNKECWIEWAIKNNINPAIIGYLSFKYGDIDVVDNNDTQKFSTPRAWERVSKLIQDIKPKDYDKLLLVGSSAIGEGVFSRFTAFCKLGDKLNIKELVKHPERLKELDMEKDLGLMYFITTALADNYKQGEVTFKDIMNITAVLDELKKVEFLALLWRLCLQYNPKFEDEFTKGDTLKIANKYIKYL